jgi:hypothetical protein
MEKAFTHTVVLRLNYPTRHSINRKLFNFSWIGRRLLEAVVAKNKNPDGLARPGGGH